MSDGRLTPDEGTKILGAVGALARIVETAELASRIEALEKSLEQRKWPHPYAPGLGDWRAE
jgi:hypothetical protein